MSKQSKKLLASGFGRAMAKMQKPGVVKQVAIAPVVPGGQRLARNGACPCGSGKKLKKCCGTSAATAAVTDMAEVFMTATKGIPQTVVAMLRAGEPPEVAYAYYNTADYICEDNRSSKSAEAVAIWDAHTRAFLSVDAETQQRIIKDITTVKAS